MRRLKDQGRIPTPLILIKSTNNSTLKTHSQHSHNTLTTEHTKHATF